MKVYIVTEGTYEDYHICGVFDTRENAVRYIMKYLHRPYDTTCIESYESSEKDKTIFKKHFLYKHPKNCAFDKSKVKKIVVESYTWRCGTEYYRDDFSDFVECTISEENDELAYKILQDELEYAKHINKEM